MVQIKLSLPLGLFDQPCNRLVVTPLSPEASNCVYVTTYAGNTHRGGSQTPQQKGGKLECIQGLGGQWKGRNVSHFKPCRTILLLKL